jgi:hypothetical protein
VRHGHIKLANGATRNRQAALGNHDENERGLVIVTGASGRIGEAIALHLGEGGFGVLAGVRRASVSYSFGTPAGEPL